MFKAVTSYKRQRKMVIKKHTFSRLFRNRQSITSQNATLSLELIEKGLVDTT